MENEQKERLLKMLYADKFCVEVVGIKLDEVDDGYAKTSLVVEPRHLNGAGIIQGGVLFTLADFALAAAANSRGRVAVLIDSHIVCSKGISSGTIYAEATEETLGYKLATYSLKITDESGEVLALVRSTAYRKEHEI